MILILIDLSITLIITFLTIKNWRILDDIYKWVGIHCFLAFTFSSLGFLISHLYGHNLWLFNIYALVEFWTISFVGGNLLCSYRKAIWLIASLLSVIWITLISRNGIYQFVSPILLIEGPLIGFLFICCLLNLNRSTAKLYNAPHFWLCLAFLVFYTANIPVLGAFNGIYSVSPELLGNLFLIIKLLAVCKGILILFSYVIVLRTPKTEWLQLNG